MITSPTPDQKERQRSERNAILAFLVVVVILFLLAAYGCMSGSWTPE